MSYITVVQNKDWDYPVVHEWHINQLHNPLTKTLIYTEDEKATLLEILDWKDLTIKRIRIIKWKSIRN